MSGTNSEGLKNIVESQLVVHHGRKNVVIDRLLLPLQHGQAGRVAGGRKVPAQERVQRSSNSIHFIINPQLTSCTVDRMRPDEIT